MTRRVEGLKWARASARPSGIPVGRPRGAKLAGIRYEREVARSLSEPLRHGQWFEYEDSRGRGVCQPDIILPFEGRALVLEVKYSWVLEGHQQLEWLYLPIVREALKRETVGLVVTKRLTEGLPRDVRVCGSLEEAAKEASKGRRAVWHWLGSSGLSLASLGLEAA